MTTQLIALRRENPGLHAAWFRQAPDSAVEPQDTVRALRYDGQEFADDDWDNSDSRSIVFVLEHPGADAFALMLNAA